MFANILLKMESRDSQKYTTPPEIGDIERTGTIQRNYTKFN
jgi:hypothetical protein